VNDVTTGRRSDPAGVLSVAGLRALPVGTRLADRYRVVALVGVGAIGMVYRARDERLHLDVALKVLRPEKVPDQNVLERFEQELVLGRQVTHRNVVRIHDIGQDGELHFLTMDHVAGRSLRQILDERGRLDVREAVSIARDLAEALAAAHAQQVVHRDLKPANVMVDAEGRACITDFGVARSMLRSGMTRRGNIVGTLDYLAPEQARGGEVDGRADIYALGLMLFEMLTGQPAFRGESPGEVIAARSAGLRRRFADVGISVPRWLRRVVNRCLAPDPERRYQNAAALAHDLASGRLNGHGWPRRILKVAAAVAAGAIAAGVLWWWYGQSQPPQVAGETPTLAVLPLASTSGDSDSAWLSTAFAETLAQSLSETADLQVTDSARVLQTLADLDLSPARLGAEDLSRLADLLDVGRLVTGVVRAAGTGLSVELQVIERPIDRTPVQTLRAQGERSELGGLSQELAGRLAASLGMARVPRSGSLMSDDAAALAAYARGIELLAGRDTVAAGMALEQAVAADPKFGAAWLELAGAYRVLGDNERALACAQQAAAYLPDGSGRLHHEAHALVASLTGKREQVQQHLAALVARYPHDVEARVALAEAYGADGKLGRARKELDEVVAASPSHPRAWLLLGRYAIVAGDAREAAIDYLARALAIQNRLGDLASRAEIESAFGAAHVELGNLDEARMRYDRVIELATRLGDDRGVAAATASVARILLRQGQYDAARGALQQALAIDERIGNYAAVAGLQDELGALDERQGRHREALARYRQSLEIRRSLGDPLALAASYGHIGFAHYELGEFDDAAFYAGGAMEIYTTAGHRAGQVEAGRTLGLLALARGQWPAAEQMLLKVLKLGRELGDPMTQAFALGALGRAAQAQGQYGTALASIEQGLEMLQPAGDARSVAQLLLAKAELAFEIGMLDGGREALAMAVSAVDRSGSGELRAEWWRIAGMGHLRAGHVDEARRAFARAGLQAGHSGSAIVRLATKVGTAEAALSAAESKPDLASLESLYGEARSLGHVPLMLQSGELLARAQANAGRFSQAEQQLRATLAIAETHAPWSGRYRLQGHLAGILRKLGRESDAESELRAASGEVDRLRKGLDDSQRAAFERLALGQHVG
jgi:serine/threonine protein kinase/tetratricopeptide (TPR) repeat protein